MQIKLNNLTLAKGSAEQESPFDFTINGESQIQICQSLRAQEIQTFNRGNLQTLLSFSVNRKHASQHDAMQYALTHASTLVNTSGVLSITLPSLQNHPTSTYTLSQAVVKAVRSTFQGNTTSHHYTMIGGLLQVSASSNLKSDSI